MSKKKSKRISSVDRPPDIEWAIQQINKIKKSRVTIYTEDTETSAGTTTKTKRVFLIESSVPEEIYDRTNDKPSEDKIYDFESDPNLRAFASKIEADTKEIAHSSGWRSFKLQLTFFGIILTLVLFFFPSYLENKINRALEKPLNEIRKNSTQMSKISSKLTILERDQKQIMQKIKKQEQARHKQRNKH